MQCRVQFRHNSQLFAKYSQYTACSIPVRCKYRLSVWVQNLLYGLPILKLCWMWHLCMLHGAIIQHKSLTFKFDGQIHNALQQILCQINNKQGCCSLRPHITWHMCQLITKIFQVLSINSTKLTCHHVRETRLSFNQITKIPLFSATIFHFHLTDN